jgi:hypothetical protein
MANKVGLWVNRSKIDTESLNSQLINWFLAQGWETVTDWDQHKTPDVDFVLSLEATERCWKRPARRPRAISRFSASTMDVWDFYVKWNGEKYIPL